MARRPNGPKKMPTDDGPGGTEGQIITQRVETTQTHRNTMAKKSVHNMKKKCNPLENLAKKLNLSRSTIYLYARQRKIPCVQIGRRYILPHDVEQRIMSLAYENWPPPKEKLQRQRKKGADDENDS